LESYKKRPESTEMFVLGIVISFEIVGRLELFTDTSTLYGEKIDISDVSQMPAICVYI